jgi:23S rRNA (uracil1939-C5)-methyltransferase
MAAPEKFSLTVEKVVAGGLGLGHRADGMVVLLPGVLPEEQVVVRVRHRRKGFLEGDLLEIEMASPDRVAPICPLYGSCGGCDFQHASYPAQLRLKQEILAQHLVRGRLVASLVEASALFGAPMPSPRSQGYRLRLRLHVDKLGRVGFYRPHSHEVVPVSQCPIARDPINRVLATMGASQNLSDLFAHTSEFEILLSPAEDVCVLLLDFARKPRPGDLALLRGAVEQLPGVNAVLLRVAGQGLFGGDGLVERMVEHAMIRLTLPAGKGQEPVSLAVEPGGFYQVNQEQNEQLVTLLLDWAAVGKEQRVLDLFCGVGNFSLPLARQARQVVGMDLQGSAIRSAIRNATLNRFDNADFTKMEAAAGARLLVERGELFDLLLLDPPRTGCREVLPQVASLAPATIIYISCDPATLTRDLGDLVGMGYGIKKMRLFDMFPQTSHLETMVLLRRD